MSQHFADTGTAIEFAATVRRDRWWVAPLLTALGFAGFIVYTTARVFQNAHFQILTDDSAHLLSPMYSPLLAVPAWMPTWVSPAMFILWAPGGFRFTCYYYRKAYYRAYFLTPPACAVTGTHGRRYKGERNLLIFQNLHRYFLYFAIAVICVLTYDAIISCIWPTGDGGHTFGMSVGSFILVINAFLLGAYTFGCHSFRHLIGGKLNVFRNNRLIDNLRYRGWLGVSLLNGKHQEWAWVSLFWVAFADFYVWMCSAGHIMDVRVF